MLSTTQRTLISGAIEDIADYLNITYLDERQKIENLTDFPLAQINYISEGIRQSQWLDLLHETQDPVTKEWTEYHGNYSRAIVSVSLRDTDLDQLQSDAYTFVTWMHKYMGGWRLEVHTIEFRGVNNPRFIEPYLAYDERHNIYKCLIEFYVDYEFSWSSIVPPITSIYADVHTGIITEGAYADTVTDEDYDNSQIQLVSVAPGCYIMMTNITGETMAYRMSTTIVLPT